MTEKNIAPGTNHIKVALPQGERKPFVLLPIYTEDYDLIEAWANDDGVDLADVVQVLVYKGRDYYDQ